MREIKFRAWYMPFGSGGPMQEMVHGKASKILAFSEMNPDEYIVEQYTGLKDKNGEEVYENDIVRIDDDQIIKIEFGKQDCEEDFGAFYSYLGYNFLLGWSYAGPDNLFKIEKLGNIHENKGLLEG